MKGERGKRGKMTGERVKGEKGDERKVQPGWRSILGDSLGGVKESANKVQTQQKDGKEE